MGSGLSMASVNKIKELANAREYSLALDIVDSQDLSKSLNPQFLRVCGEIYTYTGRYKDARRVLLIAHRLAPEARRVIFSLVYLYLKAGYRELAKTYYDIYMFDADETSPETKQLMYIYDKALRKDYDVLEQYISPIYSHTMDYDWTYEVILLYRMQNRFKEADIIAEEYAATFKNSENSQLIDAVKNGEKKTEDLFWIFVEEAGSDDDPEQEELREEESKLLAQDDLRIHPREAEITIMVDDDEEAELGSKRKLKKFLREQEKRERASALEAVEAGDAETEAKEASEENPSSDNNDASGSEEDVSKTPKEKKGFFLKAFSKKKKMSEDVTDSDKIEPEKEPVSDAVPETSQRQSEDEKKSKEAKDEEYRRAKEIIFGEWQEKTEAAVPSGEEKQAAVLEDKETLVIEEAAAPELKESTKTDGEETFKESVENPTQGTEGFDMRELHVEKHNTRFDSIVSIDTGDDDFTAESDTIEDLQDNNDFGNPFDSISAIKKEKEEHIFVPKRKTEILFEDAEIAPAEDESDFAVDDFSDSTDTEFGEMRISEPDAEDIEAAVGKEEPTEEEPFETDAESEEITEEDISVNEETSGAEEEAETAVWEEEPTEESLETIAGEEEPTEEEPFETDAESDEITEEDIGVNEVTSGADEEEAETAVWEEEPTEESLETIAGEEEPSEEELFETDAESEEITEEDIGVNEETSGVDEEEAETAVWEEELTEESLEMIVSEEEPSEEGPFETDAESFESVVEDEEPIDEADLSELFKKDAPKKKKLDYPVFRSSLFPNYHNEVEEVENNFDEVMTEANDKIKENLLKEEQMQREAEALLASLGIDLNTVSATADDYDKINEALYDGPSRDELKASLKIDSVKKDILRKLKEYR